MADAQHTPGPWEYVPGTEHHGPYVANHWGSGDICDCYTMSNPSALSVRNGGDSRPINHQHDEAEANARLIAAAPDLLEASSAILDYATLPEILANNDRHEDTVFAIRIGDLRRLNAAIAKAEGRTNA